MKPKKVNEIVAKLQKVPVLIEVPTIQPAKVSGKLFVLSILCSFTTTQAKPAPCPNT